MAGVAENGESQPVSDAVPVRFLDLADGSAMAPVTVRLGVQGAPKRSVTTSPAAPLLECRADELASAELVAPDGFIAGVESDAVGGATAWCWTSLDVNVRVDIDGAAEDQGHAATSPVPVTIDWVYLGPADARGGIAELPWNFAWMRSHGIDSIARAVPAIAGSVTTLVVPRVRGYAVRARADGFATAVERLPDVAPRGTWDVTLKVRRGFAVKGRVVGPDGRPVHGAEVHCHVTWSEGFGDVAPNALRAIGGGVAARLSEQEGRTYITSLRSTATRTDGAFAATAARSGEVLLIVFAPGHRPAHVKVADVDGDYDAGDIVLVSDPDSRLRLMRGGAPVPPGADVRISDITLGEAQPTCPRLSTDEDGAIPACWLEVGHAYTIRVRHPEIPNRIRYGQMVWDARAVLDVDELVPDTSLIRR